MKRLLWWITVVPVSVLTVVLTSIRGVADLGLNIFFWWEGWCRDYKKLGYRHLGDGVWTTYGQKTDREQPEKRQ